MNKKIIITVAAIVICLVGGCIALWASLNANAFYTEKFPAGTKINGVNCGKMTIEEAEAALIEKWNTREFKFTKNDSELGSITLQDTTYKIKKPLKELRKDNAIKTAMNYLFDKPLILTMEMPVKEPGAAFEASLQEAEFLKAKVPVTTQNAYLDLTGNKAKIVPEVQGNNIDYETLSNDILDNAKNGQFKMEYKRKDYHVKPEITSDNPDLVERESAYREYLTSNVTYILGQEKVKIPPVELAKIRGITIATEGPMTEDEINALKKASDDNVIIDSAVGTYVETFAATYNTVGKERKFTSISGNQITVKGGDYGYRVDVDKETAQLLTDLQSNKKVEREPVWKQKGFVEYSTTNDIGNTYVEISISRQRLWYYKNGKELVETPIVTGNPYLGYSTPRGTFALTYKDRGATLRGYNADGTKYESPVSYWMPFYGNYGMHDAPWRGAFGGSIYRGNGSHGCVNMPVWAARTVFNNIAASNVPVIVY